MNISADSAIPTSAPMTMPPPTHSPVPPAFWPADMNMPMSAPHSAPLEAPDNEARAIVRRPVTRSTMCRSVPTMVIDDTSKPLSDRKSTAARACA